MTQQWNRIDGMMIAQTLNPEEVAEDLSKRGIVARLEWFDRSTRLLGFVMASNDDGKLATIGPRSEILKPGPTEQELADELATTYKAEVRLGAGQSDHLDEVVDGPHDDARADEAGDDDSGKDAPDTADETASLSQDELRAQFNGDMNEPLDAVKSRIIEIGRTPASSVPLLAALEGVDIADLELPGDARALFAELPPERLGWNFGDLPLVTLSMADDEFQIFLVTDDHLEHVISFNWAMRYLMVPGKRGVSGKSTDEIDALVGENTNMKEIAAMIPGAGADALIDATTKSGDEAVKAVVAAVGLPDSAADFLLGRCEAEAVEGTQPHMARGISNAIGRSVDILLREPEATGHNIWEAYHSTALEKPWIVRVGAAVEAATGAMLVATAIRTSKPRSGWSKVAGILGSLLIIDSVAEVSLAKLLALRADRRTDAAAQ